MKIESLREVKNNFSEVIEALPKTGPVVVTKKEGVQQRLHSALGYRPPAEFEQALLTHQHAGANACRTSS